MSCSICSSKINKENAPIIAMGGYGYPRYICDDCAEKIEIMTKGRDIEEIKAAITDIVNKMEKGGLEDAVLTRSVVAILDTARERLSLIEAGEYDFSLDEENPSDGELDDIPEELRESDEDKLTDEVEAKEKEHFDKIFNWIALGVIGVALVAGVLFLLLR